MRERERERGRWGDTNERKGKGEIERRLMLIIQDIIIYNTDYI